MKKIQFKDHKLREFWERQREKRQQKTEKMKPVFQKMNTFSLPLQAIWAMMINFIIEALSRHSIVQTWDYITGTPLVFLYNSFMIFMTFSVVYLVRRRVFVRVVISAVWLLIGITNGIMLLKRVTPFNAQDLKTFTEGLSLFTNYFSVVELITMGITVPAVLIWLVSMWRWGWQYEGKMRRPLALVGVLVCVACYSFFTHEAIDQRIISTYFGNIAFAYQDYGVPYCFMASIFNTGISEPNNYNKETMGKVSENGAITRVEADSEVRPNVLFVQLESFFDTSEYEKLQTSQDPLPNLREMAKNYSSGYFKVPSVGAGTANTEFEVLTGMNLRFFGPGEYPYKTVLKEQVCESAATAFEDFDYGTHALHNNGGNFYSRAKVFNNIGFDSFTSKEFMNILQLTENGWSKDDILLTHIQDALDSTEQQDFVFTISVQGHGSYPEEKVIENPAITVSGLDTEGQTNAWEYYVNQVYEMDQFAKNLVDMMAARGEPTVIVFYGDHLPTMGLKASDLKSRYLYNTNYVIWDNIGLKKEDRNIPAYQIMADVMGRIGLHAGTVFNYHQDRRQSKEYLQDLELLQYDILYGKQYVYDGNMPITEGHMQMGIRDVTINDVQERLNGTYSIYGENFTKWSKVYINDEKQKSNFINNTRIELTESKLEDGDVLKICQVGSSNTIFRSSQEYIYYKGELYDEAAYEKQKQIDSAEAPISEAEEE